MKKILIKTIQRVVIVGALTVVAFIIVGGGYGEKDPLPESLIPPPGKPLLIAHRGSVSAYTGVPENTAASVNRAVRRGFRWVEVDVQFSADSVLFVFHDFDGEREFGEKVIPSEKTFAELAELTVKVNNIETGEHIISLDSVFAIVGDSVYVYLDMKGYGHGGSIEQANDIANYLEKNNLVNRCLVASPNLLFLTYLEWNHPEITTLLAGYRPPTTRYVSLLPKDLQPDLVANYYRYVTPALIEQLEDNDLLSRFVAFHVDEESFLQVAGWGVMRFMIDDGDYLDTLLPQRDVTTAQ